MSKWEMQQKHKAAMVYLALFYAGSFLYWQVTALIFTGQSGELYSCYYGPGIAPAVVAVDGGVARVLHAGDRASSERCAAVCHAVDLA